MDVEEVADELYGLKPTEFVAARDAYAAEARKAGDKDVAKAVSALRRPTVAAWVANLLARRRPEEARRFLEIGETLREAHRMLDAEQLRAASLQRNQLVGALTRTAADLARDEGQTVGDTVLHEIDQTLRGVLADPEVAGTWARGRLVKVPEAAVDFTAVAPTTSPARRTPPPARRTPAAAAPSVPVPKRNRALERARAQAEAAEGEVRRLEQELDQARAGRQEAEAQETAATDRLATLEQELTQARRAANEAKAATAGARKAVKTAETTLAKARAAAESAAREARTLEKPQGA
ncbi:hypothetical protein ACIRQF_09160 [Streptomyces sp. NPDC101191]|uniref:hypothetical protein n=1 Tax=Streptomyces sp. NPDC101191 TaxID=3366126 RepID=UPI0038055822